MLSFVSGEKLSQQLLRAKDHLFRAEGMLHAMRLAVDGMANKDDALPLTLIIEVIEDECENIREKLNAAEDA